MEDESEHVSGLASFGCFGFAMALILEGAKQFKNVTKMKIVLYVRN